MNNKNTGFTVLNGDAAQLPHKTVLVLGIGRGGTSMAAGVLSKLGVYMGDQLNSRYQDSSLLDCINRKDKKQAQKIIAERNRLYPVWGIKKLRLWRWDKLFRAPVYVVVFRDLCATANRRVTLFNTSLLSEMFKVLGLNFLLLVFLRLSKRPILIASYEKALLNPEDFVTNLSSFLGIDDPEKFTAAVQFINPSPSEYTTSPVNYRTARASRERLGYIDKLEPNRIAGWALSIATPEPLSVELLINGILKQTITANLPRPDVAREDDRFHERCGFIFRLADGQSLKHGDRIDVRIADTTDTLINSPQQFA
ncbi:MAG: hypothetical protein Q7U57_02590 [Methylovulum sp.]|nr:hypothetical protein [Methylovulum sp.]